MYIYNSYSQITPLYRHMDCGGAVLSNIVLYDVNQLILIIMSHFLNYHSAFAFARLFINVLFIN